MNSFKCPQCNLTNWVTAPECKRCKRPFQPVYEQNTFSQNYESQSTWQPDFRGYPQAPLKSGLAIASMVLGILGLVTSLFLVGLLLAPIGLILGLVGLSRANKNPQVYGGKGFAIVGIVLSSLVVLIIPIVAAIAIPNLMAAKRAANEGSAISSLRTLAAAEQTLMATSYKCGDLQKLGSSQLIDPTLAAGEKNGYNFKVIVSSAANVCEIQAIPADSSTGSRSFYISTQDGVIRAANKKGLPADKNDLPIDQQKR